MTERGERANESPTENFTAHAVTNGHLGWPRPSLRCVADDDLFGKRRGHSPPDGRKDRRPMPWISQLTAEGTQWDPWLFDTGRLDRMLRQDLCQVCGSTRESVVYVLNSEHADKQKVDMVGGAVCTMRCARLTATACPHFSTRRPIGIYAVAKATERILTADDTEAAERYDLRGIKPVTVVGP